MGPKGEGSIINIVPGGSTSQIILSQTPVKLSLKKQELVTPMKRFCHFSKKTVGEG